MGTHLLWFAVAVLAAVAVVASFRLIDAAVPRHAAPGNLRRSAVTVAVSAAIVAVLAAMMRVHALAHADARVVARLANGRGATLNGIFTVVTTMGDLTPSFAIAGVLAILLYRRTASLQVIALPFVVLIEIVIQAAVLHVSHDYTTARLLPKLVLGGSDGVPSGSMARLVAVFAIASYLWRVEDPVWSRRLLDLGSVLVYIELITRLYLARHLFSDIVGGLALGIILAVVFIVALGLLANRSHRDRETGRRWAQ